MQHAWKKHLQTAGCWRVPAGAALVAGVLVCVGVLFNERVLEIDDLCGAISVHGFCGWLAPFRPAFSLTATTEPDGMVPVPPATAATQARG